MYSLNILMFNLGFNLATSKHGPSRFAVVMLETLLGISLNLSLSLQICTEDPESMTQKSFT